jgi:hypothetical protein
MAKKIEQTPPEKYAALMLFDAVLTQAILKREAKDRNFRWSAPDRRRIERGAAHLCNGATDFTDFADVGDSLEQREACRVAIERVERTAMQWHTERAEATYHAREREWRNLCRQQALALVSLRHINEAKEKLRREIASGGMYPRMVCDARDHLFVGTRAAPGRLADAVKLFLIEAQREGIVTEKEVKECF